MYVIKTSSHHYTVLYQGSSAPNSGNGFSDWLANDVPMAVGISLGIKAHSEQLQKASEELNNLMTSDPKAHVDVYGHSLGSMNAQYALANVNDPSRVDSAHVYEGPNIYSTLNSQQRQTAQRLKSKVHNYVDNKDFIAFGYEDQFETVGNLHKVHSKNVSDVAAQHMWGGYQWQKDGGLQEDKPNLNHMKQYIEDYRHYHSSSASSAAQKFALDYAQAQYIMNALVADTSTLESDLEKVSYRISHSLEHDLISMENAMIMTQLPALSYREIEAAIEEQSLNPLALVKQFNQKTYRDKNTAAHIANECEELRTHINNGIQEAMNTDDELAHAAQDIVDSHKRAMKDRIIQYESEEMLKNLHP
ncbi:DUF2974 domain-containing protein [Alloscardovia theropitheci]|uniref:DUF2974 domain-containing protein n=1 Tax=Alloscardovia theropitheci TaxID=2496842 RepID=A0A4R0QXE6_9BIFI|nr:Mbeg1-like protein [Alloscardovia theropitheci]TCD54260.1 DUF2974 domain-containing protein [Alloscardovia theropitheci]